MADPDAPEPTTEVHRGPEPAAPAARKAALVGVLPRAVALPLPDSGAVVGRAWLTAKGVADTKVSGRHLRFSRIGGVLRVADQGSRNGTWINGERCSPHEEVLLDDGAVLRIGSTLFVVQHQLAGSFEVDPPLGDMVGPFGLRPARAVIDALGAERPAAPEPVLIEGETGTGKELTARAVAAALGRAAPYVAVNVAGMAAGVFESHLFGHVAGAFSGAGSAAPGIVAAHDGGTVFLDEIGELPPPLQAKLLRLLDAGEVLPVGASRPTKADVLILAATNRALEPMVADGRFRSDLYARLAMVRIQLPPLRRRRADILAIAQELSRRRGAELPAELTEVEAAERLLLEPWPRNVRQLASTLDAARRLDPAPGLRHWALQQVLGERPAAPAQLTPELVEATVGRCGGNVTQAARQLGISRGKILRLRRRQPKV